MAIAISKSYNYIPVSHVALSGDWYSEHLGFKRTHDDPNHRELRTESGVWIFLVPTDSHTTSHMNLPKGIKPVLGFVVSEIDSAYQYFINKGVQVTEMTNYGGKCFRFTDPDGNVIEMWNSWPNK